MDEGFLRANAGELFAFLTVFGSAWRILRHPIAYEDHLIRKPKETVRFFVVSAGLATFFAGIFFSAPGAEHTGIKLETIAPLHRLLPGLHIGLQGEDIIPLGMLTWAVAAVLGHLAELGRRPRHPHRSAPTERSARRSAASQTARARG
nr:hypothetical protein [uncultured Lichenicoccus sp.]